MSKFDVFFNKNSMLINIELDKKKIYIYIFLESFSNFRILTRFGPQPI